MISGENTSIYVTDVDRAVSFYTESLGLKLKVRIANGWAESAAGDELILGLHLEHPPNTHAGIRDSINVESKATRHLQEVVAALKARGVALEGDILDSPNVQLITLLDLDGNALPFVQILHAGM